MNYSRLTAAAALAMGLTFPPLSGAQNQPEQRPDARMKHPPTAQMDAATPPDKTTTGEPDSAKHPPTSLMDRAAPDQKSPGATQDEAAPGATQDEAGPGRRQEETPPGTTQDENAPATPPYDQSPQESGRRPRTGVRV
jgi:hypothetical protein